MFSIKNNRVNKRLFYKWLPLQDAFRTLDWIKMKEEIESFSIMMGKQLLTINA